jgi:hypothetical protein
MPTITSFKGLRQDLDPRLQEPNQLIEAYNVTLKDGRLEKRQGWTVDDTKLVNVSEEVLDFIEFDTSYLNSMIIVTVGGVYADHLHPQEIVDGDVVTDDISIYHSDLSRVIPLTSVVFNVHTKFSSSSYWVQSRVFSCIGDATTIEFLNTTVTNLSDKTTLNDERWVAFRNVNETRVKFYYHITNNNDGDAWGPEDGFDKAPAYDKDIPDDGGGIIWTDADTGDGSSIDYGNYTDT